MRIKISTLENEEAFVITPMDFKWEKIRGLKIYIKNLNGGYLNQEKVIIPINDSDILDLYHNILKLFEKRFSCTTEFDNNSSDLLNHAMTEEQKFLNFSSKALSIRNNEIQSTELSDYLEKIKTDSFKRTLKPFQLLAAYHLAFSQNACNFSVPGSGKTTTVLAAYAYLKNTNISNKKVEKLLVIGPLASFLAWKREYFFCFGKEPNVLEITGKSSDKVIENALLRGSVSQDLILVSYGSISRRQQILTFFLKNNKTMVVLDEAHRIKNVEDGIQSTAALQLSPYACSRVILTGTPAPNGYVDLYNLYKFIWPSHNIIGYSIPQLANMSKNMDDKRINELINRISPFFIRIKKSDLNLPDPTFFPPIKIEMSMLQERIYDAIAKMAIGKLENGSVKPSSHLSAIIRLRQAASNPALLNQSLDDYYETNDDYSTKIELDSSLNVSDEILEIIKTYKEKEIPKKFVKAAELAKRIIANGEQLVVWCEFIGTCDDLSCYFNSIGIPNKLLYGKTDYEEREKIIEEFTDKKNPSSFKIIIANPHAVGESISLHTTCHNALYLEQSFNAGSYMQSKDRIHRVGLLDSDHTNYYFIQSEDTIDETVYERVNDKENRMLKLIESQEIPLIVNNRDFLEDNDDDIKAIIRGYYEYRNKHI